MVIRLTNKMKDKLAFFGGVCAGFVKLWNDHGVVLMASRAAAIIEGAGTALLFGACGVIGKKLGDIIWDSVKKLFRKNETNSFEQNAERSDGDTQQ